MLHLYGRGEVKVPNSEVPITNFAGCAINEVRQTNPRARSRGIKSCNYKPHPRCQARTAYALRRLRLRALVSDVDGDAARGNAEDDLLLGDLRARDLNLREIVAHGQVAVEELDGVMKMPLMKSTTPAAAVFRCDA